MNTLNNSRSVYNPYKTRMCISTEKNIKCSYGNSCRFAHSIEELQTIPCIFGNNCKYIEGSTKLCLRIHPGEKKEDVVNRMKKRGYNNFVEEFSPISYWLSTRK